MQEQQHLSSSATRAIAVSRRRGIFQSMQFWFDKPLVGIEISPCVLSFFFFFFFFFLLVACLVGLGFER